MHTTAIFGCPGTGKTTHLAKLISQLAPDYPNMAVVSFSRAAAGVLTSRLRNHSIRYIGTLHALAFRALGLTRQSVATEDRFATWYGADIDEVKTILSVYNYSYHHKVDLAVAFTVINPIIPFLRVEHLIQSYLNWKETYQYLDFNDMVAQAISRIEPFDVVIVDEAQDCTNEQWQLVLSITKPTTRLYVAGDDDQSLFTWAGANPHGMIELADEQVVLGQSYRIPKSVHALAEATVGQISRRVPKEYKPITDEGTIECVQHYEPMWYRYKHTVLCRDKWALDDIEQVIIERGIPYTKNGERGMFERGRCQCAKAIMLEDHQTVKRLSKYLRHDYREDTVGACRAGWQKALDFGTWYKESNYLALVDPCADPLIHLSTVHGFKGEEDDRVVLVANCTSQVEAAIDNQESYDNEVRVWYVGLTRCKQSLTIVGYNQFINFKRGEQR